MTTRQSQNYVNEIMAAYADCHGDRPFEETSKERNLSFRSPTPLFRDEAIEIMRAAVPDGYNNFNADLLKLLPNDCMITIARESSVCIYTTAKVNTRLQEKLGADECGYEGDAQAGETRLWWD